MQAVAAVARGEQLWTPEQIAPLQRWWQDTGSRLEMLTGREVEVLRLVVQFRTNDEVAKALGVTRRAVESHVCNMLHKLGLRSRRGAARRAWEKGGARTGGNPQVRIVDSPRSQL